MHLVNFPKVRVKKYPGGYVVEMQHKTWYGRKCWKHIVSVYGMPNKPWYYSSYDIAVSDAAKLFEFDLHHGTARNNGL